MTGNKLSVAQYDPIQTAVSGIDVSAYSYNIPNITISNIQMSQHNGRLFRFASCFVTIENSFIYNNVKIESTVGNTYTEGKFSYIFLRDNMLGRFWDNDFK